MLRYSLTASHSPDRTLRALSVVAWCEDEVFFGSHHAKALLEDGDLSVAEVAQRVGFGDSNYFSRLFRRKTGKSPRQWRQVA